MNELVYESVSEGNLAPPQAQPATPLDWLTTQFALELIVALGPKFNLRRDINDVLNLTARHLVWPVAVVKRLQKFMTQRCTEHASWKGVGDLSAQEFMHRHGVWNSIGDDTGIFYYLDEYVKQHAKELFSVFRATIDELGQRLKSERILLKENIELLSRVLDLTSAERTLLLYASLTKYQRDLRPVLVDCKVSSAMQAYQMLADVVGCPAGEIAAALKAGARLETLNLIDTPIAEHLVTDLGDLMRVSDKLLPVLMAQYHAEGDLMAVFTRPTKPTELALGDFPHVENDVRYVVALLKNACGERARGVNVLLYGPPGTGKTELAKLLAKEAVCELYEVDCFDKEGNSLSGRDRYRSLQVSQAFLRGRSNTVLLFDEVEDVFPSAPADLLSMFSHEEPRGPSINGKAWVNQTLEQNPVPTIWICNAISQIDPAYKRRFQYHLELTNPPQGVREAITRKHLEGLAVDAKFVAKLAERKTLTPAQVQSAARFARLARATVDESVESLILRQLDNADKALGVLAAPEHRPTVTQYDLARLHIESRYPVEKIVEALKVRGRGTLCFFGPPGTGKTALGEHIARSVERPLIIKRASDILSKYVGETEQNMAAMFAEAQREKAVLLLDEADSFLQSRMMAQRNYEVSEVNEMLQGMERFDGVFICTTNLFDRIDEAALRRFTFKIRFKPLTREQREAMFIAEALQGDASRLSDELRTRLAKLMVLTPGDFAAVKRQAVLFDEGLAPEDFLLELEREHAVKPEVRETRSIGFAH